MLTSYPPEVVEIALQGGNSAMRAARLWMGLVPYKKGSLTDTPCAPNAGVKGHVWNRKQDFGDSLPVSTMNLYFSAPWTCTSQPPKQWEIIFCKLVTTHYLLCPKLTVTKVTGPAWHELRLIHLQRCQILGKQCDLWGKNQAPRRFKCLEEELCSVHQKFYFSPLREVNIHPCKLDSFCKLYVTLCVCEEH